MADNAPGIELASGQTASPSQAKASNKYDYVISACDRASFASSVSGIIFPTDRVKQYLAATFKQLAGQPFPPDTKLTILQGFKHGEMVPVPERVEGPFVFRYVPRNLNEFVNRYGGIDYAVLEVEMMGKRVKLQYKVLGDDNFVSRDLAERREWDMKCPYTIRRIRMSDGHGTFSFSPDGQQGNLESFMRVSNLSNYVGVLSGVILDFKNLPGIELGQTTGQSITLDTDAAGHGWFVDATPDLNEEFLPTSNPYEWVAKTRNEAEGKMDMLSVFLHEYGYALRLEHSADSRDFMVTTLTPGVRRLPSADELALMQQLSSQINADIDSTTSSTSLPDLPKSPSPSLPLSGGFAVALFGRLRGNRYGGWTIDANSTLTRPQYDIAAIDPAWFLRYVPTYCNHIIFASDACRKYSSTQEQSIRGAAQSAEGNGAGDERRSTIGCARSPGRQQHAGNAGC